MVQSVNTNRSDAQKALIAKIHLEKIAKNLSDSNLAFIAEISEKKGINDKLEAKKMLIKSFI